MRHRSTVRRLASGLVLAMMLLAGCQRASYSFQGSPPTFLPAEASISADTAAPMAAPDNVIATAAGRRSHWAVPARHAGQARHWVNPAALRPAAAVALSQPKVLPGPLRQPERPTGNHRLPTDPKPYHKGVAFALAVLLGFFGAHHFYLGHQRDGFRYLSYTLIGLLLLAVAVPLGNSKAFGPGFGGLVVALFLLGGGIGIVAGIYMQALFDAIRILTGDLAP